MNYWRPGLLIVTLINLGSLYAVSQSRTDHWCIGDSIHIRWDGSNFVYEGQVPFFSKEGGASISDEDGNLLFYSDGRTVWDANHTVVPGGTNLSDSAYFIGTSIAQGTMLLPGFDSLDEDFYVFTKEGSGGGISRFFMSVIRIDSFSGQYSIDSTEKKLVAFDSVRTEALTAVRHGNGRDWWLLTAHDDRNKYIYIRLFSNGVFSSTFKILIDSSALTTTTPINLTSSYAGDLLGFSAGRSIYLLDFDRCNGELSVRYRLTDESDDVGAYSLEFSSNGKFIYGANNGTKEVYQFSTTSGLMTAILPTPSGGYPFAYGQLQRAPDKSIYLAYWTLDFVSNKDPRAQYLGRIPHPDSFGLSAGFDTTAVWLGGRYNTATLPNHPHYELGALEGSPCDTLSPQPSDTTSSIGDDSLEALPEWSLYPNPVSSTLMVEHPIGSKLVLQDLHGRAVREWALRASPTAVSVEGIPDGLYLAVLQDRNGKMLQRSRVLVQH